MATIEKNIKNRSGFMLALLFMLILGAGTIMAMKAPDKAEAPTENKKKGAIVNKHKKQAAVVWYYNGTGTSEAAFQNGNNWNTTNSGTCGSSGNRPCQISADASTQAALSTYLSDFTHDEILDMSSGKKP